MSPFPMTRSVTIYFGFLLSLTATLALAQQVNQNSLFFYNKMILNPAYAGVAEDPEITLSHRSQWLGFKNAPVTQTLTFSKPYQSQNYGLGGILTNDMTGPLRHTELGMDYSHHFSVSSSSKISLGLSGSLAQYAIRGEKIELYDNHDQLIDKFSTYSTLKPDASFGSYFYSDKYWLGLSIIHLFKGGTNVVLTDLDERANLPYGRHFFLIGGYEFDITDKVELQPLFLFEYVHGAPAYFLLGMNVNHSEFLNGGIIYGWKDGLKMNIALKAKDNWMFGTAYDLVLSPLRKYNSGTVEFLISYKFIK